MGDNVIDNSANHDVDAELTEVIQQQAKLDSDVKASLNRLGSNKSTLEETVYRISNPNPVVVGFCIIGVIVVMVVIYNMWLRPDATGIWSDERGNVLHFRHSPLSGRLVVTSKTSGKKMCMLSDNMFKCGSRVGVWDYNNIILFVNGGGLTRSN